MTHINIKLKKKWPILISSLTSNHFSKISSIIYIDICSHNAKKSTDFDAQRTETRIANNEKRKMNNQQQMCSSHRFLWEHKVARKVKVCKLLSQLFSCTLIMGTKSCSKSFQKFAFDTNRALGGKSLQAFATFCHGKCCDKS